VPTYDYVCEACGHEFEHFQSMSDRLLRTCPKCGKKRLVRRIGAGAGLIFKGSGFYVTDYKRAGAGEKGGKADDGGKGDGGGEPGSSSGPEPSKSPASNPSDPSRGGDAPSAKASSEGKGGKPSGRKAKKA
jgi:putative FmdB family regulatory protein